MPDLLDFFRGVVVDHGKRQILQFHGHILVAQVNVGWNPHLLDLTCLIGIGGLFIAGTAYRLRACNLVPTGDPRLDESLAFENM